MESFIVHAKYEFTYENLAEDVETRFSTSNYKVDRPLATEKNQNFIELMKNKLGGGIMKEFVKVRPKIYSKGTKKCVIKHEIKFEGSKNCLENNEGISQQKFRMKHAVYSLQNLTRLH